MSAPRWLRSRKWQLFMALPGPFGALQGTFAELVPGLFALAHGRIARTCHPRLRVEVNVNDGLQKDYVSPGERLVVKPDAVCGQMAGSANPQPIHIIAVTDSNGRFSPSPSRRRQDERPDSFGITCYISSCYRNEETWGAEFRFLVDPAN